jgi:hypothetical protein
MIVLVFQRGLTPIRGINRRAGISDWLQIISVRVKPGRQQIEVAEWRQHPEK